MGFLDRFKREKKPAPTPSVGGSKTMYRPPRSGKRNLEAVEGGRLYGSWSTTDLNEDLVNGLATLRARARDLEVNNDYIRKYLNNLKCNVIGPQGIALQCQFRSPDGSLKQNVNSELEREFKRWGRRGVCDVTGKYSWPEIQRILLVGKARDGESFLRHIYDPDINEYGYAVQLLDPTMVPESLNGKSGGNIIRMGIEFSKYGRPVAYYINANKDSYGAMPLGGNHYIRVAAEEIEHGFKSDRVDGVRGLTWFSSVMLRLKMLSGMESAALVSARVGASSMGFFVQKDDEDGRLRDDLEEGQYEENLVQTADPGAFELLPRGVDFKSYDPSQPKDTLAPFIKSMLRAVSSGLPCGSYNSIANDREGVSYSSLRHAHLDETDAYKELQAWVVDVDVRPVYQSWLKAAVLTKKLNIPPRDVEKYMEPNFVPRRWANIDPLKQAKADIAAYEAGMKSKSEIVADHGKSYDELALELKQEQDMDESLGIRPREQSLMQYEDENE